MLRPSWTGSPSEPYNTVAKGRVPCRKAGPSLEPVLETPLYKLLVSVPLLLGVPEGRMKTRWVSD